MLCCETTALETAFVPGNLVTRIRIFSDFSLNSVIFRVHVPMANPKRGYGATSCGEGGLF